ncbi:MAG: pyruvate ferredoxin oxidoreductase [Armatimonadetes bacterium CG_4_10_14_3_um_filter_59_10]|nr:MAG: pyruvate ferredoxin oxidoreductase [Armatimonadetes bacterium CG_4_10_14_3_um_filter_59_10]
MRELLSGNYAAAEGARLCRAQVVAAFPITPQTQIVERIADWVANGEMHTEFIKVESEHSAMAACIGASAAGARAFTATSSQGLALMHELLHWAAGGRFPVVICNVNRAMAPAWNIWSDHTDSMSQRDTGFMQLHCETNQDVLDFVIWAYKTAETVGLPALVNLDAFTLSHSGTPVDIPDQNAVDAFLPAYQPEFRLDPDEPYSFGNICYPDIYFRFRRRMEEAMVRARLVFDDTGREFGEQFGRLLESVRLYRCEDADHVIILVGSVTGTAQAAVDRMREKGIAVGLASLHVYRPFPIHHFLKLAGQGHESWLVLDRSISFGMAGPIATELASLLGFHGDAAQRPRLHGFVGGLGGKDIVPEDFEGMIEITQQGRAKPFQWLK